MQKFVGEPIVPKERLPMTLYKAKSNSPLTYKPTFGQENFPIALTFDDVLLVPQYSKINSRSECSVASMFSKNVPLNVPIVSSPMDTVTETDMAVNMAKFGGLGILHRFNTIEEQARMVRRVKRSGAFINTNPLTIGPNETYKVVKDKISLHGISSFLVCYECVVDESPGLKASKKSMPLKGILTNRDIMKFEFDDQLVKDMMTPIDKIIALQIPEDFDRQNYRMYEIIKQSKGLALKHRVYKIPLVNDRMEIHGLICLKDIFSYEQLKLANKDPNGKLYVGAAVGANKDYIERAERLVEAGCNVLVVDVANGHSQLAIDATETLKDKFSQVDIVAGSIATGEGAERLIRSGADGIRCGIGNGSICITRIVAGSGVPQLTALLDTSPVCQIYEIPLCSDGGNRYSGNMCKALASGANCVMLGRLVAGCDESPGKSFLKEGKFVKMFRGMAGLHANISKQERTGKEEINPQTFASEGVEGYIPYMGPLEHVLAGFTSGIKSGMSYTGAFNLEDFRKKARFVKVTASGFRESHVHDINQI